MNNNSMLNLFKEQGIVNIIEDYKEQMEELYCECCDKNATTMLSFCDGDIEICEECHETGYDKIYCGDCQTFYRSIDGCCLFCYNELHTIIIDECMENEEYIKCRSELYLEQYDFDNDDYDTLKNNYIDSIYEDVIDELFYNISDVNYEDIKVEGIDGLKLIFIVDNEEYVKFVNMSISNFFYNDKYLNDINYFNKL